MVGSLIRCTRGYIGRVASLHHCTPVLSSSHKRWAHSLAEVGKIISLDSSDAPSNSSDPFPQNPPVLPAGTFFIHKLFGYRGVVLDSWHADIYSGHGHGNPFEINPGQSSSQSRTSTSHPQPPFNDASQATSPSVHRTPYYVALVDSRDQAEQGTSFAYVSHTHALPYHSSNTSCPLDNYLFSTFLIERNRQQQLPSDSASNCQANRLLPGLPISPYVPSKNLAYLQTRHQLVLQYSKVFRQVTHGIEISVIPFYMEFNSHPSHKFFMWAYVITMLNTSKTPVKLLNRHWHIVDGSGKSDEVVGPGVIGKYPVLHPGAPAFEYTSHVNLSTPHGRMFGFYEMEEVSLPSPSSSSLPTNTPPPNTNSAAFPAASAGASKIKVTVPTFILDSPHRHRFGMD